MSKHSVFVAILLTIVATTSSSAQQTHVYAGKLISCTGDEFKQNKTIIIEDEKIISIEDGYIDSDDASVIDLRDYTVMPGLMDMHTHLMTEHHKDVYSDKFFLNESDFALRSTVYAERTLLAGFTTVRDLGDNGILSLIHI